MKPREERIQSLTVAEKMGLLGLIYETEIDDYLDNVEKKRKDKQALGDVSTLERRERRLTQANFALGCACRDLLLREREAAAAKEALQAYLFDFDEYFS